MHGQYIEIARYLPTDSYIPDNWLLQLGITNNLAKVLAMAGYQAPRMPTRQTGGSRLRFLWGLSILSFNKSHIYLLIQSTEYRLSSITSNNPLHSCGLFSRTEAIEMYTLSLPPQRHQQIFNSTQATNEEPHFSLFHLLPPEIRLRIWHHSLQRSRIISVYFEDEIQESTEIENPPGSCAAVNGYHILSKLLRVNYKSRKAPLSLYRAHIPCRLQERHTGEGMITPDTFYFNPEYDFLWVGSRVSATDTIFDFLYHLKNTYDPHHVGLLNLAMDISNLRANELRFLKPSDASVSLFLRSRSSINLCWPLHHFRTNPRSIAKRAQRHDQTRRKRKRKRTMNVKENGDLITTWTMILHPEPLKLVKNLNGISIQMALYMRSPLMMKTLRRRLNQPLAFGCFQ